MARFKALQKSFNETSISRVKRTKSILESKNKININIDKLDEKFSKNKSDLHLAHVNWTSWVNTERNPSARELHQSLESYLEHYSIYYPHLVDIGRKLQKISQ